LTKGSGAFREATNDMAPYEARISFAVAMLLSAVPAAAAPCDSLASLSLPHTNVTLAQSVAAGQFAPPGGGGPGGAAAFRALPAFCRVTATLQPSPDSAIRIEVWMPASGWNSKLQSVGNGAWAGTISYSAMAAAVAAGYAAASTDTGHTGNNATFVVGHPERLVDFAYRSVHEMTVAAKAIAASFYGNGPVRSYFNGCSTGGRQALAEAQRFPNDYDGIVAGAAANYPTHLQGAQVWTAKVSHQDEAGYIPPGKYPLLHNAALQACDALDGVTDGVLEDPTRCHFEPAAVLTGEQAQVARKIYAGPVNPRTGESVFPGLEPGSEMGWDTLSGKDPLSLANETYQYLVFQDASWDYRKFDPDHDVAQAEKVIGATMDAIDPNLRPFFGHGGKLLMYHGWADPGIAPLNSVHYYSSVVDTLGGAAKDSIRLFMVPGMGHCHGGDGTDTFDPVATLDQWVAQGRAPDQILASHSTRGAVDKTRPLCPYPQVATYKGSGDTNEAANFACRMP
jgi:feruloyl esterase